MPEALGLPAAGQAPPGRWAARRLLLRGGGLLMAAGFAGLALVNLLGPFGPAGLVCGGAIFGGFALLIGGLSLTQPPPGPVSAADGRWPGIGGGDTDGGGPGRPG